MKKDGAENVEAAVLQTNDSATKPQEKIKTNDDLADLKNIINKLESISKTLALAATGDCCDQFGKYIASLLRKLPPKKIQSLKGKILNEVLEEMLSRENNIVHISQIRPVVPSAETFIPQISTGVLPELSSFKVKPVTSSSSLPRSVPSLTLLNVSLSNEQNTPGACTRISESPSPRVITGSVTTTERDAHASTTRLLPTSYHILSSVTGTPSSASNISLPVSSSLDKRPGDEDVRPVVATLNQKTLNKGQELQNISTSESTADEFAIDMEDGNELAGMKTDRDALFETVNCDMLSENIKEEPMDSVDDFDVLGSSMMDSIITESTADSLFRCDTCSVHFPTSESLGTHCSTVHPVRLKSFSKISSSHRMTTDHLKKIAEVTPGNISESSNSSPAACASSETNGQLNKNKRKKTKNGRTKVTFPKRTSTGDAPLASSPLRLQAKLLGHFPVPIPPTPCKQSPTRACKVCKSHKIRSETRWLCEECQVPLHIESCFKEFHINTDFKN